MAFVLDQTASGSATTQSSISGVGTAAALTFVGLFRGEFITGMASGTAVGVFDIGGGTEATRRMGCFMFDNGDGTFGFAAIGGGTASDYSSAISKALFTGTTFYRFVMDSNGDIEVYTTAGTLVAGTNLSLGAMPSASGNGLIRCGALLATHEGGFGPNPGMVGQVDGFAVYTSVLASSARTTTIPTGLDSNIVGYWPFEEGAGVVSANEVSGGVAVDLTGTTWISGGTWDGAAIPPGFNGYWQLEVGTDRWQLEDGSGFWAGETFVASSSFQAAWARGANRVLMAGRAA